MAAKGIALELVGHTVLHAATLDHVTGSDVIWKDDRLVPDRAAGLLDLLHRPNAVLLDRPERKPRTVRTVENVPCRRKPFAEGATLAG